MTISPERRRRRWPLATGIAALVLLAHALALDLMPHDDFGRDPRPAVQLMHVRQMTPVDAPRLEPEALVVAEQDTVTRPPPKAAREAPPAPAPAAAPEPEIDIAADPTSMSGGSLLQVAAVAAPAAPAAAAVPTSGSTVTVPTYPTRLPGAATLQYELQHGPVPGEGELTWRPRADGYEMSMNGEALGIHLLTWTSRGGVDETGLAPVRFVDRRRRSERAANFERGAGRISFSGPSDVYPLVPGAQDRLSFMVQLPAIIAADPSRFGRGATVSMFVVGARGDGDVWSFDVIATEAIDVPAGRVARTLHLRRQPRKPFDQQVDVWLDPARDHLPVRVRLADEGRDNVTDFRLRRYTAH